LSSLCLVSRNWNEAAKPWLWRRLEVRLPHGWLSLVEQIAGDVDAEEDVEQTALDVGKSILRAENAAMAARAIFGCEIDENDAIKLHENILATLGGPDGSIPPELLSPPASRDPSPRRLREKSKSPTRWRLMRSISDAVQTAMSLNEPGIYVPPVYDPRPGRYVKHLDFNHFRTIGMRRSVEEGMNSRFVTGDRLEAILKESPNLKAFGATEYMDGALTLSVMKELFLRGSPSRVRGRSFRGRQADSSIEDDAEDRERRRYCLELEAVDLTGCVSAVFVNALTEFVNNYVTSANDWDSSGEEEEPRGRHARFQEEPMVFPGLQRLCLRGAKSVPPAILNEFVLALPSLTHLDLSGTRVTPDLLASLGSSSRLRLHSLSLARCIRLTSESITEFLIDAPAAKDIKELNLYGDATFSSPLTAEDLEELAEKAPCFSNGELVYLDLSSAPITKEFLDTLPAQPQLRSLGLSYIPMLRLDAIAEFIKIKAPVVEVMTLIGTSPDLGYGIGPGGVVDRVSPRQASIALHSQLVRPLCTPPFSFSLTSPTGLSGDPPTRVRVIELATPLLAGLGAGAGSWRIIRSKGGRGWYVDTASGWVADSETGLSVLKRDLVDHPWKQELQRLADANGNVSTGVGWHARKMEVLHGHGMMGHEDGLYGAVSFAYQG